MYPTHPYPYPIYAHDHPIEGITWTYTAPHPPQVDYYIPSVARPPVYVAPVASIPGSTARVGQHPPTAGSIDRFTSHTNGHSDPQTQAMSSSEGFDISSGGSRAPGAKNVLDIQAIESGVDTRTTVMIKNIPNKMTDRDLKIFIDRVCPRRIDFMYLRMDFQNGGYSENCRHAATTLTRDDRV